MTTSKALSGFRPSRKRGGANNHGYAMNTRLLRLMTANIFTGDLCSY